MKEFKNRAEEIRAQTEWAILNLVRELRGIVVKGAMPTYYNSIKMARQLMPEIFDDDSYFVQRHHEPELVRFYRQQAEARSSLVGRKIDPLELLDERIAELTTLTSADISNKDLMTRDLARLKMIRPLFQKSSLSEDFILANDVKCMRLGVEPLEIKAKYSDYQITEDRVLRVRLIHPDQGEQSMGADLIYEQYDPENRKVRFVMNQYKIWDGKTLYWSQARNLAKQIQKMSDNLCANKYCLSEDGKQATAEFRYPYCSAFLRPTDKLQHKESALTSSGMHIPICKIGDVLDESRDGNAVLSKSKMKASSINQQIFEDCFNNNQVGSRWMSYEEAEDLYVKHKILESGERIILHAQELEL